MNDPRFEFGNRAALDWQRRNLEQARQLLADASELARIEQALEKAAAIADAGAAASQFSAALASVPSTGANLALIEALRQLLMQNRAEEGWGLAARLVLGRVLGRCAAGREATTASADTAADEADRGDWNAFLDAFVAEAIAAGRSAEWAAVLSAPLKAERYLWEAGDRIPDLSPPERLADIWKDQWLSAAPSEVASFRWGVLIRLGPEVFSTAFSMLPNVPIQRAALEVQRLQDRDFLLRALRAAPPAFREGGLTNAGALLLLEATVTHAERLSEAMKSAVRSGNLNDAAVTEVQRVEVPAWFDEVLSVVEARPDGVELVLELGRHLAQQAALPPRMDRTPRWTAQETALVSWAGFTSLSRQPSIALECQLADPRESRAEVAFSRLLFAAYVAAQPTSPPSIRLSVWNGYVGALRRGDGALEGHVNPFGGCEAWVHTAFGMCLVAADDFPDVWSSTWRDPSLEQQRASGRFEREQSDAPSVHLLRSGYAALTVLGASSSLRRDLWGRLFDAALSLALSDRLWGAISHRRDVTLAFAHVHHVFGEGWREAIGRAVPAMKTDARLVLYAAANMVRNGIARDDVVGFLREQGMDPIALGRELVEWEGDRASSGETKASELLAVIQT